MVDLFSTNVLNGVVANLKVPASGLLDRYFSQVVTETSEEIHFDVDDAKRRLAPFVSPLVAGKLVESRGYQTSTFKPAYVKDKRVFDANRPFRRAMGEQIGGTLDPATRMRAVLATELEDMVSNLTRRLEVMASEALRTGIVTVSGDSYDTVAVNFGRAAALTPTALASTARWGQSAAKPLDNLQDWADLVTKQSGAVPTDVIMGVDAWKAFRADSEVKSRIDLARSSGGQVLNQGAKMGEGLTLKGQVDGFNIFVYSGWYVDPADGQEKPIFPADIVVMTSPQIEGRRAFGAIRDEEAGFQAVPYYAKSWVEKDPAVRLVLMQSAPLVVPYRVNASLAVDVL